VGIVGAFEEADGQHHFQFGGKFLEVQDRRVLIDRGGQPEQPLLLVLAEIGCLEQLLQEDDLSPFALGFADEAFGGADVLRPVPTAGHLGRGGNNVHLAPSSSTRSTPGYRRGPRMPRPRHPRSPVRGWYGYRWRHWW